MRLSDFIRREIDPLTLAWESFARTCLPAARPLSSHELRDHCAVMLRAFANDMDTAQSAADQHGKSKGLLPQNAPAVSSAARDHALQRFAQGFTLNQMIAEYRALRASVTAHWTSQLASADAGPIDELVRYGEALDQAMAESVALHLEQIEKSRALLLGVLGHDLRNPLAAVRLSGEYLLRAPGLTREQAAAANRIVASAGTMQRLIADLLDLRKTVMVRSLPLKLELANLREICSEVVDELLVSHLGRSIHQDFEGDLVGRWDPARLRQLVSNLVANAIQHGAAERPIRIAVTAEPQPVCLQVRNEGEPISAELQATLFQPAVEQRGRPPSNTAGASGLGLGLYIAHEIVVAHLGAIDVASSAAEGTTITLRLPRAPELFTGTTPLHLPAGPPISNGRLSIAAHQAPPMTPLLTTSFDDAKILSVVANACDDELDQLEFGLIGFDADGVVQTYNAYESKCAGLSVERVKQHHLFTVVAPCMNNYLVAQRFEDAAREAAPLDLTIDYVLTLRMKPVKVKLRLLADPALPLRYVLVLRRA